MDEDETGVPDLEKKCRRCDGDGKRMDSDGFYCDCAACDGAGYFPTEAGEKILALMRHNFGPMLRRLKGGL